MRKTSHLLPLYFGNLATISDLGYGCSSPDLSRETTTTLEVFLLAAGTAEQHQERREHPRHPPATRGSQVEKETPLRHAGSLNTSPIHLTRAGRG